MSVIMEKELVDTKKQLAELKSALCEMAALRTPKRPTPYEIRERIVSPVASYGGSKRTIVYLGEGDSWDVKATKMGDELLLTLDGKCLYFGATPKSWGAKRLYPKPGKMKFDCFVYIIEKI